MALTFTSATVNWKSEKVPCSHCITFLHQCASCSFLWAAPLWVCSARYIMMKIVSVNFEKICNIDSICCNFIVCSVCGYVIIVIALCCAHACCVWSCKVSIDCQSSMWTHFYPCQSRHHNMLTFMLVHQQIFTLCITMGINQKITL